jgi:proline dehydrogenase
MLRATLLALSRRRALQRMVSRQRLTAGLARRFVAGDTLDEAVTAVRELNRRGFTASLDHLGENVAEEQAARVAAEDYLGAFDRIAATRLDANVSIKLTQLGLDISAGLCRELLRAILERARQLDNFVRIDMEGSAYTERTLDLVLELHREFPDCGVVLQSYLYRTLDDVRRANAAGIRVRLVKGAYDEPPTIAFARKSDVDSHFARAMEELLLKGTYPAIATHDERLTAATVEFARQRGIAADRFEFQMLYGIRRDLQESLLRAGYRVRVYVPYGTEWYPYLMRRLAERPANVLFLIGSLLRERRGRRARIAA